MKDTMKIALGVSGFATLLALTVPSNFNAPKPQQPAEQPIVEQVAPPVTQLAEPIQRVTDDSPYKRLEEADEEAEDSFSFGDPTSDALPYSEQDQDDDETYYNSSAGSVQSFEQSNGPPAADTTTRPRASRVPIPAPSNNAPAGRVEGNVLIE